MQLGLNSLHLARSDPGVAGVAGVAPESLLYLSVLAIGEVRKPIDMIDSNNPKRTALQSWLNRDVRVHFAERILAFDDGIAERWAQLEAAARKRRVTLPTIDAQMAATALHHNLTLVTRNTSDVESTGIAIFNPFGAWIP